MTNPPQTQLCPDSKLDFENYGETLGSWAYPSR